MGNGHISIGRTVILAGSAREALEDFSPRTGSIITVSDEHGKSFRGRVVKLATDSAEVFVFEDLSGNAESGIEIVLLQALPDKERMELIIQKATELGVDMIVPFKSKRSIDLAEREARQPKAHRWQDIALRAARQCRRGRVPLVAEYTDMPGALKWAEECSLRVVLWEGEKERHLKNILRECGNPVAVALMNGPEGGWTKGEIKTLEKSDYLPTSLGGRILRTETAAITAVALAQYELGDLG